MSYVFVFVLVNAIGAIADHAFGNSFSSWARDCLTTAVALYWHWFLCGQSAKEE